MENLIIKRKEFEILENLGERSYKIKRKDKIYFAKKFEPKSEEFFNYLYAASRIKSSLVPSPHVKIADKKTGYVVSEFYEGQTVLDYLLEKDPEEDDLIYKNIFACAHLARANGMVFDFKPDNWIITPKGLVYMKVYFARYERKVDFTQTNDIRLWFITRELGQYAREQGKAFNVNRLKDEYLTNKHIVLVTCKHYQ